MLYFVHTSNRRICSLVCKPTTETIPVMDFSDSMKQLQEIYNSNVSSVSDRLSFSAMSEGIDNLLSGATPNAEGLELVNRQDVTEQSVQDPGYSANAGLENAATAANALAVKMQPKTRIAVDDDPEDEETPLNSEITGISDGSRGSQQSSTAQPQRLPSAYTAMLDGKKVVQESSSSSGSQSSGAAPRRQSTATSAWMYEKAQRTEREEHPEIAKRKEEADKKAQAKAAEGVDMFDLQREWEVSKHSAVDQQTFSSLLALSGGSHPPRSLLPTTTSYKEKPAVKPLQRSGSTQLPTSSSNNSFVPPPAAVHQGSPPSMAQIEAKAGEVQPKPGGLLGFAKRVVNAFTPKIRRRSLLDQTRTCERKWLAESKQVLTIS